MRIISVLFLLLFTLPTNAQDFKSHVYKGTIGANLAVTFYLQEGVQPCTGETVYEGMYQYTGKSTWLQLDITAEKEQLAMVEYRLTGILLLRKISNALTGLWISPDGKRQLPVKLFKTTPSGAEQKRLEDTFEKVNYENHDC